MIILFTLLMIGLIVIDQLIKHAIVAGVALGATKVLVPGVLSLTNLQNDGAAWSILSGQQWLFTIITVFALAVMIYYFWVFRHYWPYALSISLLIAGTLGNFIDRATQGYVVDMFQLDFIHFPIFNFADTCLTVGVVLLLTFMLFEERMKK
ncbi:signal peptidase II [Secundilactobacillus oryzae JCM 18671]|uniref:Lipoprotein signal peptidase n=1 Tax=Secundilactobacillus oryzae JCM 18671 TaxID=1291743 RepID=A0A081BIJ8_9LACO|nr:signal peptidase II [Secundilactobacillus oryzae JCM 18671]